jgi:hypothetical protein
VPSDWERVVDDPALLAAARLRYTGSGDVLDQLWWIEHPGAASPGGAADPAVRLLRDRQDLYRPGGDPRRADALRREESSIAADRDAARQALAESIAAGDRQPAGAARGSVPGAARRTLAGAVVAALVIGGAAGFAAARFSAAGRPAAVAVFDRRQTPDDRPPGTAPLPSNAVRPSLRHLATSSTTGAALYAARSRDGGICLVVVVRALEYRETCTSDAAFALSGLSMTFAAAVDPTDDSGIVRDREISPTWTPEGEVRF